MLNIGHGGVIVDFNRNIDILSIVVLVYSFVLHFYHICLPVTDTADRIKMEAARCDVTSWFTVEPV